MGGSGYENRLGEEESMGTVHTSIFLIFSLSGAQDDLQSKIPRTKDDILMYKQLPCIFPSFV